MRLGFLLLAVQPLDYESFDPFFRFSSLVVADQPTLHFVDRRHDIDLRVQRLKLCKKSLSDLELRAVKKREGLNYGGIIDAWLASAVFARALYFSAYDSDYAYD